MRDMKRVSYAEWLRRVRRKEGLTQGQLAAVTGLARTYLSNLENGGVQLPTRETRAKLHAVFNTSDEELIDLGVFVINSFGEEVVPPDDFDVPDSPDLAVVASTHAQIDQAIRQAFFADMMEKARQVRWNHERMILIHGILDSMLLIDRQRE